MIAALFGASQIQIASQDVEQGARGVNIEGDSFAIQNE
jgi:hypothetical protein